MALETAKVLWEQVSDDILDSSFEFEDFKKIANRGLNEISGRVLLPALETSADVYAGTATITAETISFTETGSIIADSDNGLVEAGFHVGETITITGAGDDTNNQTTTISSIESNGSQMVAAGTLADEAEGEEVTIANSGPSDIPMPSTYQRHLFYCYSLTNTRPIQVYKSRVLLQRDVNRLDLSGRVVGVATYGSRLYYQRIPSTTEELRLSFYELPTAMTAHSSTPDCLPEELASDLVLSYAKWKAWALIEQDVSGDKTNAAYWKGQFEGAGRSPGGLETGGFMAQLQDLIGPEHAIQEEIVDDINYEAYL